MLDQIDFLGMTRALQAEMDDHLGYAKNDSSGDNTGNSRNGYTGKSVIPDDIRRAIYTTNAIESLNFCLRKITRNKSSFPDDDSIYKVIYLAIKNVSKRWTVPIREWGLAVNQFAVMFPGRVPPYR